MNSKLVVHGQRLADVLDAAMFDGNGHSYNALKLRYRDDGTEQWVPRFHTRELSAGEVAILRLRGMVKR
jgi:hypothetical protein